METDIVISRCPQGWTVRFGNGPKFQRRDGSNDWQRFGNNSPTIKIAPDSEIAEGLRQILNDHLAATIRVSVTNR